MEASGKLNDAQDGTYLRGTSRIKEHLILALLVSPRHFLQHIKYVLQPFWRLAGALRL